MKRRYLFGIWTVIIILFNILGIKYVFVISGASVILYNIFMILCASICQYFYKDNIQKCLIPIFTFTYWAAHHSFALFRLGYLNVYPYELVEKTFLIVLLSTIVLFIGMNFGNAVKCQATRLGNVSELPIKVYYFLLIFYGIYFFFKMYFAGGIRNYFYSTYASKIPESVQTLFFILNNIFYGFAYLNVLYVVKKRKKIRILAILFFIFTLINTFMSGGSTGILYLVVALIVVHIMNSDNKQQFKKVFVRGLPIVIGALYIGLLIRYNRADFSNFSFDVINHTMDYLLKSATFDCQENLLRTIRDFTPTYTPSQFIYPLINWLPRSIFPWKPTELGTIMATQYYKFGVNANAGFATSPMGDFYYDFGYLGIVFGIIIEGSIIGYLNSKFSKGDIHGDLTKWQLIFLMYLCSNVPNWWTGFGVRLFYMLIFYIMIYLAYKFLGSSRGDDEIEIFIKDK